MTGQMMIYTGIGLSSVSFVLLIILSIVFSSSRKKLEKKIAEDFGE